VRFVARSFSGDRSSSARSKGGVLAQRTAVVDVISPCVTFNNHEGSTRSYLNVKEHDAPLHDVGFIPLRQAIEVEYGPARAARSSSTTLPHHPHKLEEDYDRRTHQRLETLHRARQADKFVTGLLYLDPDKEAFGEEFHLATSRWPRCRSSGCATAEALERSCRSSGRGAPDGALNALREGREQAPGQGATITDWTARPPPLHRAVARRIQLERSGSGANRTAATRAGTQGRVRRRTQMERQARPSPAPRCARRADRGRPEAPP